MSASTTTPLAWSQNQRQNKYHQNSDHQAAIEALRTLLDDEKSHSEVAKTIADLYEPAIRTRKGPGNYYDYIYTFWATLCDAIRTFGGSIEQSERLVDFLISISNLPDIENDEHGIPMTIFNRNKGVYWKDLPEFAVCCRDYLAPENYGAIGCVSGFIESLNGSEWSEDEHESVGDDWYPATQGLLNATTFSAGWASREGFDKSVSIVRMDAEAALDHGLEDTSHDLDRPHEQQICAARVIVAATWILLAGDAIYRACVQAAQNPAPEARNTTGLGLSMQGWRVWKDRLSTLAEDSRIDVRSRDLATQARDRMVGVEESYVRTSDVDEYVVVSV
jgi:hypothetical protein